MAYKAFEVNSGEQEKHILRYANKLLLMIYVYSTTENGKIVKYMDFVEVFYFACRFP